MATPSERISKPQDRRAALLRQIPSVDELLNREGVREMVRKAGRDLVVAVARKILDDLRTQLTAAAAPERVDITAIESFMDAEIARELSPSLKSVINATGVVLHTNLGRAPLAKAAVDHVLATATLYSNLEYDLASGSRGKRDVHTNKLLAALVGAEAAIVVNNNAAAVFLVLNTLAKNAEVIVSRGELIEIGDGFRIPDIMAESGAGLKEIGTTNRTRIADYERAINDRTKLLLRVHPSNFRIVGFTARPSLEELVALGRRSGTPVCEDLGSGCLVDLSAAGIAEPVAQTSLDTGVSIVTFSGDKMLGGPQAGIIAGKKDLIERIRRNPLFRALRVDKLTIAALEATLLAYRRGALNEIPALRMIRLSENELEKRARAFAAALQSRLPHDAEISIVPGHSVVGGGSTPDQSLLTRLIALRSRKYSAAQLEDRLRRPADGTPVISRIADGLLVLDLRTVFPEEEPDAVAALLAALT
jgi:L-seryl-tRNA(Ser) seleniumtransferase